MKKNARHFIVKSTVDDKKYQQVCIHSGSLRTSKYAFGDKIWMVIKPADLKQCYEYLGSTVINENIGGSVFLIVMGFVVMELTCFAYIQL